MLEQWLIQWKPGDMSVTFLVFLSFGMFWLRVWPWLTREYIPARQRAAQLQMEIESRREESQLKVMQDIADTLAEVKTLVQILPHLAGTKSITPRKSMDTPKRPVKKTVQKVA